MTTRSRTPLVSTNRCVEVSTVSPQRRHETATSARAERAAVWLIAIRRKSGDHLSGHSPNQSQINHHSMDWIIIPPSLAARVVALPLCR